jgi:hypothetical protein
MSVLTKHNMTKLDQLYAILEKSETDLANRSTHLLVAADFAEGEIEKLSQWGCSFPGCEIGYCLRWMNKNRFFPKIKYESKVEIQKFSIRYLGDFDFDEFGWASKITPSHFGLSGIASIHFSGWEEFLCFDEFGWASKITPSNFGLSGIASIHFNGWEEFLCYLAAKTRRFRRIFDLS